MKKRTSKILFQAFILLCFFLIPIFNIFRLDLVYGYFYLFRIRFSFNEAIVFLLAILLLVLIFVTLTKFFNRYFCRWMCPHNSFLAVIIKITTLPWFLKHPRIAKFADTFITILFGPLIAFSFLAYFINPSDMLTTIISLNFVSVIGTVFLFFTVIFFMLIRVFKQRFCKFACPYGLLQNVFSDKKKKSFKDYFSGINLVLILLLAIIASSLLIITTTGKGFDVTIINRLANVPVEDHLIFSYDLIIKNVSNQDTDYIITYENIPQTWRSELYNDVNVPGNENKTFPILFHIPPDAFYKNHLITIRIFNDRGKEIIRTFTIYPVP